jgi:hypothetical protein
MLTRRRRPPAAPVPLGAQKRLTGAPEKGSRVVMRAERRDPDRHGDLNPPVAVADGEFFSRGRLADALRHDLGGRGIGSGSITTKFLAAVPASRVYCAHRFSRSDRELVQNIVPAS